MKKQIFFTVIVTFFLVLLFGEESIDKKIKRLEKNLNNVSGEKKVDLLNELASEYYHKSVTKAIECNKEALKIAQKIKYKKGVAFILGDLGWGYIALGDYETAMKYCKEALDKYIKIGDKFGIANSYNKIGTIYFYLSQYENTLKNFMKTLEIFEEINHEEGIAKTLNNIGNLHWNLKNFPKALEYYLKSLKKLKKQNNQKGIATTLSNIGLVYRDIKDEKKALDFYKESLGMREKMGDEKGTADTLNNMGEVYRDLRQYPIALDYYKRAFKIYKEQKNKNGMAISYNNIGDVYVKQKKYEDALEYFNKGMAIALEIKAKDLLKDNYRNLYELYEIKGNYKKALENHKMFYNIDKKIFNEKISKQITEIQTRYKTAKKEKEIEILKKEKEMRTFKSRLQISIVSIVFVIILTVIFYSNRYFRVEMKRKNEKQKKMLNESKLKIFQSRIFPHFISNVLTAVGSEKMDVSQKTKDILYNLKHLHRLILDLSGKEMISIKEELDLVECFMKIEKIRYEDRLNFIKKIDTDVLACKIIPISLEPVIENAVEHGVAPKHGSGNVELEIKRTNNHVHIIISDTGVGFDTNQIRSGEGLFNVMERLKLAYKNKATFYFESEINKGTIVKISIPYEKDI